MRNLMFALALGALIYTMPGFASVPTRPGMTTRKATARITAVAKTTATCDSNGKAKRKNQEQTRKAKAKCGGSSPSASSGSE